MNVKSVSNVVWFLSLLFVLVVLPGSARASVITTDDVDPGGAATQLDPWLPGRLKVGDSGTGTLDVATGGVVSSYKGYIGYESNSTGEATVTGAGSKLTHTSCFFHIQWKSKIRSRQ